MKLQLEALKDKEQWKNLSIQLPQFNIEQVRRNTKANPTWVHFGAGNIFRAFVARKQQELLDKALVDTGIITAETFDMEVVDKVLAPNDNLALTVLMNSRGESEKVVVSSITESLRASVEQEDYLRLVSIFEKKSLQMASFTITEKGYNLKDFSGNYLSYVEKDLSTGPDHPTSSMSILTALLYKRYLAGRFPMTLVSMDNCSHNGDKLRDAVQTIAKEWNQRGFLDFGFVSYVSDETKVTFPLTMIDKITPRPSDMLKEELEALGLEAMDIVVTSKNTYIAPFVNAEVSEYLVIEDKFTNGRPPLEQVDILFCDRETVNKIETMKVTTCLNPLHTALAVTGCLLGHQSIAKEMEDQILNKLVRRIGYEEGLPVVINPQIIDPFAFLDEVVNERFTNHFIPDTPQRIATDTSQKVAIRFGETIKAYALNSELSVSSLTGIALAIASWCRYLMAIDDNGQFFTLSPDPMIEYLNEQISKVQMGDQFVDLVPLLSNRDIFGVNLYEVGLGPTIEAMFLSMIQGNGAVRKTLENYLN